MGNGFFQSIRALFRLKPAQKLNRDYLISLLCAVLLAFLVGAGIMLLCGFDPIQCYGVRQVCLMNQLNRRMMRILLLSVKEL